jgi:glycosyltransferase involved in cell wall biosynthesis
MNFLKKTNQHFILVKKTKLSSVYRSNVDGCYKKCFPSLKEMQRHKSEIEGLYINIINNDILIPKVINSDSDNFCLTLTEIKGISFDKYLLSHSFSNREKWKVVEKIVDFIIHLEDLSLAHGDLSFHNIIINQGQIGLIDPAAYNGIGGRQKDIVKFACQLLPLNLMHIFSLSIKKRVCLIAALLDRYSCKKSKEGLTRSDLVCLLKNEYIYQIDDFFKVKGRGSISLHFIIHRPYKYFAKKIINIVIGLIDRQTYVNVFTNADFGLLTNLKTKRVVELLSILPKSYAVYCRSALGSKNKIKPIFPFLVILLKGLSLAGKRKNTYKVLDLFAHFRGSAIINIFHPYIFFRKAKNSIGVNVAVITSQFDHSTDMSMFDKFCALSNDHADYLVKNTEINQKDVYIFPDNIPNYINTMDIKSKVARLNMGESLRVICVGNYGIGKGFHMVVNSILNCDVNVHLKVIGKMSNEVRSLILPKAWDDNRIEFVNFTSDVDKYYKWADVLIHPSSSDVYPKVIREAKSYGVCVITTKESMADITNEVNGIIINKESGCEIISAIKKVLNSPEKFLFMSLQNIDYYKNYKKFNELFF